MIAVNLDGTSSLFEEYPALEITWHKISTETYCHNACLVFAAYGNVIPQLCKVSLDVRTVVAPATPNIRIFEVPVTQFLPCKVKDKKIYVPLNSWELVKALQLCEYTKSTKSKNINLVHFPSAIEYSCEGISKAYAFNDGLPPALICKKLIDSAETGDKICVQINLTK